VFQIAGTGTALVSYNAGLNEVTVSTGGQDLAVLRSTGDLSGFGVDDITFI